MFRVLSQEFRFDFNVAESTHSPLISVWRKGKKEGRKTQPRLERIYTDNDRLEAKIFLYFVPMFDYIVPIFVGRFWNNIVRPAPASNRELQEAAFLKQKMDTLLYRKHQGLSRILSCPKEKVSGMV